MSYLLRLSVVSNICGIILGAVLWLTMPVSPPGPTFGNPSGTRNALVTEKGEAPAETAADDAVVLSEAGLPLTPPPLPSSVDRRHWLDLRNALREAGWPEEDVIAFSFASVASLAVEAAPATIADQEYWQPLPWEDRLISEARRSAISTALYHLLGASGPGILDLDDLPIPVEKAYEVARMHLENAVIRAERRLPYAMRFTESGEPTIPPLRDVRREIEELLTPQ